MEKCKIMEGMSLKEYFKRFGRPLELGGSISAR
jgi:hypothetical protein